MWLAAGLTDYLVDRRRDRVLAESHHPADQLHPGELPGTRAEAVN